MARLRFAESWRRLGRRRLFPVAALLLSLSLFTLTAVPAQAHVEGGVSKTLAGFKVQFAGDPKFPVEGQKVTLLFSIQNATTETDLTNFQAVITVNKGSETVFAIRNVEFVVGDIEISFVFASSGEYVVQVVLFTEERLVFSFPVEVTSAGQLPVATPEVASPEESEAEEPEASEAEELVETPVIPRPIMFDPAAAMGLIVIIGVVPLYIGSFIALGLGRLRKDSRYFIASVAIGIALLEFFDLMSGASTLGIEFGLGINLVQIILVASFAAGLLSLAAFDRLSRRREKDPLSPVVLSAVAGLIAVGVGFHSLGEGIVVGFDLKSGFGLTFIAAALQALSFALHKLGEGIIIITPLLFAGVLRRRIFGIIGIAAGVPLVIGTALTLGGLPGIVSSYAFAAGAGALFYAIAKLFPLARQKDSQGMLGFSYKAFIGLFIGLFFLYSAGLLHTTSV